MSELTFESVNEEIEKLDLEQLEQELNQESLDFASKICKVWSKVSGVIKIILKIPFPGKWKKALRIFIKTLDSLCAN